MIIFDLDGTLADCQHRRHFVEPPEDHCGLCYDFLMDKIPNKDFEQRCLCGRYPGKWKLDWKAFYEGCDQDKPIYEVISMFWQIDPWLNDVCIWSGRCESVREKTEVWLLQHVFKGNFISQGKVELRMRPEGDYTPDEELKERWLAEALAEGDTVSMVFDDRPKVVRMWRSKGIFVFDCNQSCKEF